MKKEFTEKLPPEKRGVQFLEGQRSSRVTARGPHGSEGNQLRPCREEGRGQQPSKRKDVAEALLPLASRTFETAVLLSGSPFQMLSGCSK